MGRAEICRSDGLERRIEELILEAGGRARAVLALMEHAAPEASTAEPSPADADGTRTVLVVRLTSDEARAVEAAHAARGMSRAEWVRAVLRRQISDQRPLSRVDRGYLRKAMGELQALRQELTRMRAAVAHSAQAGRDLDAQLGRLGRFERKLVDVAEAIHRGFLGEDRYWCRLDAAE